MRTETQALRCRSIQTDAATRSPRVFITGDTHGDIDIGKLSNKSWKEQKSLSSNDILIVTGDFGVPWTYGEDKTDKYILKWYSEKPYTIVFVDGNHDNEDAIRTYPELTTPRGKPAGVPMMAFYQHPYAARALG